MTNRIFQEIANSVVDGNYEKTIELCERALQDGHSTADITIQGLSVGMTKCGKKYGKKGMFLDTILWSTVAFQMGLASISSASDSGLPQKAGKVVLGVMDGPWTIGKDIVSAVLSANNFDVSPSKVAEAVEESGADIVAIGLYLSYRADTIRQLEEELFKAGLRQKTKIILSGPSANRKLAGEFGADAYARDAEDLADLARKTIEERKREMTSRERVMTSLRHQEPDRVRLLLAGIGRLRMRQRQPVRGQNSLWA
jgi:5-methyltetrahydrofolate--homocysteine methyltransferase